MAYRNQRSMKVGSVSDLTGECVAIISLGCVRNLVDSEKILVDLKRRGARVCPVEMASIIVINTCAFTRDAKMESIQAIFDCLALKNKKKIKKLFVYGCLPQRYLRELKKDFKEIDEFAGVADFKASFDREIILTPRHFAYLKISEGCANCCSFCAIPSIKGPLRSRSVSAILDEVKFLEGRGVVELNIVGQDTTLFGMDCQKGRVSFKDVEQRGIGLARLVEKILKVSRIPWLRILYLHPLGVSDDLIDLMASEKRVCPYIDLPLQHINDRVLKLMNRGVNRDFIERRISDIRSKIRDVTLRTTFIVGFPSEKKSEFLELLDFIKVARFEKLGVFAYSREEGTKAYKFKNQLVEKVKKERYDTLMFAQREISSSILKSYYGSVIDVLVEEKQEKNRLYPYVGRSRADAPEVDGRVFLHAEKLLRPGRIVKARVNGSYEYDLKGEVV